MLELIINKDKDIENIILTENGKMLENSKTIEESNLNEENILSFLGNFVPHKFN